jgi:hypothetical protein
MANAICEIARYKVAILDWLLTDVLRVREVSGVQITGDLLVKFPPKAGTSGNW